MISADKSCHTSRIATTFIYALTDPRPDDAHVYIGKADRPRMRLNEHRYKANYEQTHKAHWFRQLQCVGLEPTLKVIKEVPECLWEIWEMTLIQWYRALGWNVVNTCEGGEGGYRACSRETAAKISAANKGKKWSEDAKQRFRALRQRIGHPCQGKHLSAAHKAMISARHTGKVLSAETRAKMSAAGGKHLKGKPLTQEHRAKLSASKKGRPKSAEHRAKLSAAHKGKQFSDETRRRMSESAKVRCQRNKLTPP